MTSFSTDAREIRIFGFLAALLAVVLLAVAYWRGTIWVCYVFGLLLCIAIAFILVPGPSAPLYKTWIRIAHLANRFFVLVSLTLMFYLVIAPVALIRRLANRSPLPLKPNEGMSTYWVRRSEGAQPIERFLKRY